MVSTDPSQFNLFSFYATQLQIKILLLIHLLPTPMNVQSVTSSLCLGGVKEEFVSLKKSKDTSQTRREEKKHFGARNLRLVQ